MPTISVYDMSGSEVGEITLKDDVFGIEPNASVMHEAVVNYLANQRQGTQSTLTRSEVRGGGKKPWRQKGTGHARQGSTRSPQWRHGGIALGPKPRSYTYKLNKKVRRLAMKSAFSAKVLENNLIVVDNITLDAYRTKDIARFLAAIGVDQKALIVLPEKNDFVIRSAGNIAGVQTALVNTLNVYDIMNADKFIIAKDAAVKMEEVYA